MLGHCTMQYVIEADGSVYPCDFYMLDVWRLGNLTVDSFPELERRRQALGFIEASCVYPPECHSCKWASLCRCGCRRDRLAMPDGSPGVNRYCGAFRSFFEYAVPKLTELVRQYGGQ